jgi:hypothetical protein
MSNEITFQVSLFEYLIDSLLLSSIDFRPGLVVGLGYRVIRVIFFYNQNNIVLVKKIKINRL